LGKFGIVRQEAATMRVMEKLLPERFQYLRTRVWSVCITTKSLKDEDWNAMRKMEYLRDGRFGGLAEGDAVLRRIETLQKLTELNLGGKAINDDNMGHLVESMPQVQRLFLNGENLGDAGIARIAKLPALQWFSLYNSRISDQGLMSLAGVASLRELILYKTSELTEEGVKAFKAAREDVKVQRVME
jgi:hypothetical protein